MTFPKSRFGFPTEPDVKRLEARFPRIEYGEMFPYKDIEDAIKASKGSFRFSSVVSAWRKKIHRETGHILIAVVNEGYRVATPGERVDVAGRAIKKGVRSIYRGATIASGTDRKLLTNEQRKVCDHLSLVSGMLAAAARVEQKDIPTPSIG